MSIIFEYMQVRPPARKTRPNNNPLISSTYFYQLWMRVRIHPTMILMEWYLNELPHFSRCTFSHHSKSDGTSFVIRSQILQRTYKNIIAYQMGKMPLVLKSIQVRPPGEFSPRTTTQSNPALVHDTYGVVPEQAISSDAPSVPRNLIADPSSDPINLQ